MKISICIPIYNVENYIERCLKSALEQTYDNIEYILVDDCSTDKSIDNAKKTLYKYPLRKEQTRIIRHQQNLGLAASRNTALQASSGDYILWLDSDDYIDTNCVELLCNELKKEDYDIISFDMMVHNKYNTEIWKQPLYRNNQDMLKCIIGRLGPVCVCGRIIKRDIYVNNNITACNGINMGEDFQVSIQLSFYAKKVKSLNKPLYHYDRSNIKSYTYGFKEDIAEQGWKSFEIVERFIKDKNIPYIGEFYKGKVNLIVNDLLGCATTPQHKQYFYKMREKLNLIDKKYWFIKDIGKKPILYINNYYLLYIYIRIAKKIKHIIHYLGFASK